MDEASEDLPPASDAKAIHGVILALVPTLVVLALIAPLPVIPAMVAAFSHTAHADTLVPLALVIPTLAIAVAGALLGMAGDRIQRRTLLIVGTAIFSVAAILPLWLTSLPLLLISRTVTGLALGAMLTAAIGLTGDYFNGRKRAFWLSAQSGIPAGIAILGSAASGALGELSWRLPFALLGSGFLLLAMLLLVPSPRIQHATTASPVRSEAEPAFRWGSLGAVLALTVIASLVIFPPSYEFGFLLQERGRGSALLAGLMTSAQAVGAVAGSVLVNLAPRLSPPARIALSFAAAGLGMAAVVASTSLPPLLTGAVLIGVAQGMVVPALSLWLLDRAEEGARSRAVGVFQTLLYLSQFAAPLAARQISLATGGAAAGMQLYVWGAFAAATIVMLSLVSRGPGRAVRV